MASVNDAIQLLVQFPLYPPSGEGQREPRWVWSKGKGEVFDPILEPCPSSRCTLPREKGNGSLPGYGSGKWRVSTTRSSCSSSSRCTLPREKGNGSLGGYGPRGRVRVSTRSWSLVPVPVVPSLGRRATGACLGMARVNGECQRRDPVARPVPV